MSSSVKCMLASNRPETGSQVEEGILIIQSRDNKDRRQRKMGREFMNGFRDRFFTEVAQVKCPARSWKK